MTKKLRLPLTRYEFEVLTSIFQQHVEPLRVEFIDVPVQSDAQALIAFDTLVLSQMFSLLHAQHTRWHLGYEVLTLGLRYEQAFALFRLVSRVPGHVATSISGKLHWMLSNGKSYKIK